MLIAIVTFSVMFSISVVGPLMGLLVDSEHIYLGVNPNFSIGLIFALGGLSLSIFQLPFSNLSDKYGRKPFILFGSIIVSGSIFMIGYSGVVAKGIFMDPIILGWSLSAWFLAIFRILQGIGGAMTWPILMAMIPPIFTDNELSIAMGVFGAAFGLGMALGPVIGPALAATINIYSPFVMASLLAVVATLLSLKLPESATTKPEKHILEIPKQSDIIMISFAVFTLMFGMGSIVVIYPKYLIDILKFDVKQLASLMAAASLSFALLQPGFGKLANKLSNYKIMIGGFILSFFSLLGLAMYTDYILIMISMLFFGISGAMIFPTASSIVGEKAKASVIGSSTGFFNMMLSFGVTLSPMVIGILSDIYGYNIAFLIPPIMLILGIIMILKIFIKSTHLKN